MRRDDEEGEPRDGRDEDREGEKSIEHSPKKNEQCQSNLVSRLCPSTNMNMAFKKNIVFQQQKWESTEEESEKMVQGENLYQWFIAKKRDCTVWKLHT